MGTILDTTVFITLERAVRTLPQRGANVRHFERVPGLNVVDIKLT